MKELLVLATSARGEIKILVPKQRGTGFLLVPFGHHQNSKLAEIADQIGFDLWGLDGSLDIQTGPLSSFHIQPLLDRIIPPLAEHYGFPWRIVNEGEFWQAHPLFQGDPQL